VRRVEARSPEDESLSRGTNRGARSRKALTAESARVGIQHLATSDHVGGTSGRAGSFPLEVLQVAGLAFPCVVALSPWNGIR